jgi:hypothetical protein
MKKTVTILLFAFLAACAPRVYQLNGQSQQEFNQAYYECKRDREMMIAGGGRASAQTTSRTGYGQLSAGLGAGASNIADIDQANQLFDLCMRTRGFTW